LGVLGGGEGGVGAELVGGGLKASFEGGGGGVFFRWGDPLHRLWADTRIQDWRKAGEVGKVWVGERDVGYWDLSP